MPVSSPWVFCRLQHFGLRRKNPPRAAPRMAGPCIRHRSPPEPPSPMMPGVTRAANPHLAERVSIFTCSPCPGRRHSAPVPKAPATASNAAAIVDMMARFIGKLNGQNGSSPPCAGQLQSRGTTLSTDNVRQQLVHHPIDIGAGGFGGLPDVRIRLHVISGHQFITAVFEDQCR